MTLTQSDIARILCISRSTVSRALANSPLVSSAVKARVLAACAELGYEPDYIASSMSTKETRMISVVAGAYLSTLHSKWVQHLRHEVIGAGYMFRWDDMEGLEQLVSGRSADGFIIFGGGAEELIRRTPALVTTDCRSYDELGTVVPNSVSTDNMGGARQAVEHLVSLGHRSVAFFGLQPNGVCRERHMGYAKAMNNAGLPAPDSMSIVQPRWHDDYAEYAPYAEALQALVRQGATAILASTDVAAVAVIKLLREAGLSVPGDVSVVGFDETVLTRMWEPRVTVVRQDLEGASRAAVEMLLGCMRTREVQDGRVIPTTLVIGDSTGPPLA